MTFTLEGAQSSMLRGWISESSSQECCASSQECGDSGTGLSIPALPFPDPPSRRPLRVPLRRLENSIGKKTRHESDRRAGSVDSSLGVSPSLSEFQPLDLRVWADLGHCDFLLNNLETTTLSSFYQIVGRHRRVCISCRKTSLVWCLHLCGGSHFS